MEIIVPIGAAVILVILASCVFFMAWSTIKSGELSHAERQFKITSLALSSLSVIASAVFAASSLYIAISTYEYESKGEVSGKAVFYLQSESAGSGWAQVTVSLHNEGGAPVVVERVVVDGQEGEEQILPAVSYIETFGEEYDEFGVKPIALDAGSVKTFRVKIGDVQDSPLADMTISGCAVHTLDGTRYELPISFIQGFHVTTEEDA